MRRPDPVAAVAMLELLQFRHSPYNEKVRWALDVKRVPHRRRSLLPGPHLGIVKPLTGRTTTPVLLHDGQALDGSARIIEWLEARYEPALLPADPALREEALRIERWFDEDLTPRIRRTVLAALLEQPSFFARVFGDGTPPLKRTLYACIVPIAAPLVRKGNGITGAASIEDGHRAAREAFDFVAQRSAATGGYLCGSAFSVADLTAASTLAVLVRPADSPMAAPRPVGRAFRVLMERYAAHPGADWVRGIYAKHRGAATDFDGASAGSMPAS